MPCPPVFVDNRQFVTANDLNRKMLECQCVFLSDLGLTLRVLYLLF